MWSIIPANDEIVIRIEPVVGVSFQDVAVILLIDADRAAISESHLDLECVVIDSGNGDVCHVLSQNRPNTGDSILQQGMQGVAPRGAVMLRGSVGLPRRFVASRPIR